MECDDRMEMIRKNSSPRSDEEYFQHDNIIKTEVFEDAEEDCFTEELHLSSIIKDEKVEEDCNQDELNHSNSIKNEEIAEGMGADEHYPSEHNYIITIKPEKIEDDDDDDIDEDYKVNIFKPSHDEEDCIVKKFKPSNDAEEASDNGENFNKGDESLEKKKETKEKGLQSCPHCTFSTKTHRNLKRHLKIHFPSSKKYYCNHENCSYSAKRKEQLKLHLASRHGELSYLKSCPHCDYISPYSATIKRHIASHLPGTKSFVCFHDDCSYSTTEKRALDSHLGSSHGDATYLKRCPHCTFATGSKSNLKIHLEIHLPPDKKTFKCGHPGCGYSSAQKVQLTAHLSKKHGESVELKKCPMCSYSTEYCSHLRAHIDTHLPKSERTYQCNVAQCSYGTASKAQLVGHIAKRHGQFQSSRPS